MAFVRIGGGSSRSDIGPGVLSVRLAKALRWVAVPCASVALASWSVATLAGLHSAASLAYSETFVPGNAPYQGQIAIEAPQKAPAKVKTASAAAAMLKPAQPTGLRTFTRKPAPASSDAGADPFAKVVIEARLSRQKLLEVFSKAGMAIVETPSAAPSADPFAKVVADARLSHEKLLLAFADAGMAVVDEGIDEPVQLALAMPAAERFRRAGPEDSAGADPLSSAALSRTLLGGEFAYPEADDAKADNPVQLALASVADDPFGMGEDADGLSMPESVDLPPSKPAERAKPADAASDKDASEPAIAPKPGKAAKRQPPAKPEPQALAYARPDKPETAGAFNNLFNKPKAGPGVAIYDISAGVVHMPDGSKLEAHSGIGKMADNPRFVHVKMNGPTPPNTYRLSMREQRFHGVEAVRMTPVGGQAMHGRTGILAHSYLLRGGRAESHGCVAFKDYPKFLKAFKQGKVKQLVVVPSMSKMPKQPKVQMVSNSDSGA
ncbi:MAG: DUF2778 domain-containing protein [Hyphomicrobiales bacterium]|nr:DUF2778 domain-containing protein [Hyphomicrobiales bacterium]